jgi:hypothetical protein
MPENAIDPALEREIAEWMRIIEGIKQGDPDCILFWLDTMLLERWEPDEEAN